MALTQAQRHIDRNSWASRMPRVRRPTRAPFYLSISGERYFHVLDPDGHELSIATPQYSHPRWAASAESSGALDAAAEELKAEQQPP